MLDPVDVLFVLVGIPVMPLVIVDVEVTSTVNPPVITHSFVVALTQLLLMIALLRLTSCSLLTSVMGSIVVIVMTLLLTSVSVTRRSVTTEVMNGTSPCSDRISVFVVGMACRTFVWMITFVEGRDASMGQYVTVTVPPVWGTPGGGA